MSNEIEFKEMSPSSFFQKNKQLCGFDNPIKSAYTSFRELFENSLDACEIAQVQPKIQTQINTMKDGMYSFIIIDNGLGVPPQHVANAFGKVFYGSKYELRQHRGELGMGGKMALLNSLVETDKPYRIVTATPDGQLIFAFTMGIDLLKNEPIVYNIDRKQNKTKWRGLGIQLYTKSNFPSAINRILTYLDFTTIVCPYITVTLTKDKELIFQHKATTNKIPVRPKVVSYHPHGVDLPILKALISSSKQNNLLKFLCTSFQRIGGETARKFLTYTNLTPETNPKKLNRQELLLLVEKLQSFDDFLSPDISCLSPITEEIFLNGIKMKFQPDFCVYSQRRGVHTGHPIIVECVIAIGGNIVTVVEKRLPEPYRFANKIPLLYDKGNCALYKVVRSIYPSAYKLSEGVKVAIFLNASSTHIPYKTVGKEYISPDYSEINNLIGNALKDALRKVKVYMSQRGRREYEAKKKSIFDIYLPLIAESLSPLAEKPVNELNDLLHSCLEGE